ncbi:unnamed protein product [Mytilus coruscus]|uniref:Integrase catalytic domain-containing protein n=1 Tax=Mytilus coruscus TaxID=42192 RepID=A0A6J8EPH0_MYTCO|nr:unnamed protein product [Mytilus coruscus]
MFTWGTDQQLAAFDSLKTHLKSTPILAYPLPKQIFILNTNASNTSIGPVLSQIQEGVEKVTSFTCRRLGLAQEKYCVAHKELLVVVSFTEKFKHYLLGQRFLLRIDHSSLTRIGKDHSKASAANTAANCTLNGKNLKQTVRVPRAPLISIPPIDEPFQRIALDLIGPLPMTDSKNRYALVCVDYATKYREAIPLKDHEARTVANALISLFFRVGISKELLTDQGSNFMSKLMVGVCRLHSYFSTSNRDVQF